MRIPLVEKTLRGYVKHVGDRVFYRVELGLTPNQLVREALERMRKGVVIDESVILL